MNILVIITFIMTILIPSIYNNVPKQTLIYRKETNDSSESFYRPIRIHAVYKDVYFELSKSHRGKLILAIDDVILKMSQLLSVFPVTNPMLLKRSGCYKEWTVGVNIGKCQSLQKFYHQEVCGNTFVIPDDHLDGLYLWNDTHPEPVVGVYSPGPGIPNTDFVLYVESMTTETCGFSSKHDVIAYAEVCQTDQHDRPIAGYINICPQQLIHSSPEKLFKTLIHELFHTLGFSIDHFGNFKQCFIKNDTLACKPLALPPVQEVSGTVHMITQAVVREAQNHFGCYSESKFGAPLDGEFSNYSSHWDSRLMYSSIMAPKIGVPRLTYIDRITLAVFEDTGWYTVDYSLADNFLWGQNTGCVTRSRFCSHLGKYSCKTEIQGCHYMHRDKGTCVKERNDSCGIFQTDSDKDCQKLSMIRHDDEIYGNESACFISNIMRHQLDKTEINSGRCYKKRCSKDRTLEVKVQGSEWITCPFGQKVKVKGYIGVIKCPFDKDVICPENIIDGTSTAKIEKSTAPVIRYSTEDPWTHRQNKNKPTSVGVVLNLSIYCILVSFMFIISIIK